MSAASARPHVVMVPLHNAQGHINPMMQFAKRLAADGILVTIITIQYTLERMLQVQQNSVSSLRGSRPEETGHGEIRLLGVADGFPPSTDRQILSAYFVQSLERVGRSIEDRLQKLVLEEPPVTCVIGDLFVECVRDMTNKLKIPRCIFHPQCGTILTIFSQVDEITANIGFNPLQHEVHPFGPNESIDLIRCIPGVSELPPAYLPFHSGLGEIALQAIRSIVKTVAVENLHEPLCIIGNSFDELEPEQFKAIPNFYAMGPLLPSAFLDRGDASDIRTGASFWNEEDCTQWLDKQPGSSVLYVSFGSLTKFPITQIHEIALGLIASQQRFLWVIRTDQTLEEVKHVSDALPEGFADLIEDQGKVIQWASQPAVLSHPAVGGFFTHCGWNSILESMIAGVPMLGWPHVMDQLTNCWMVEHKWKIGFELKRDAENKTDREEVERAVRKLMEGEETQEMKAKAAKLRKAAKAAVAEGASSNKNLQFFVHNLYKMASLSALQVEEPKGHLL